MEKDNFTVLLEWRNMSSELFEFMHDLGKKYRKKTGRELYLRGGKDGWSEMGYDNNPS